MILTNEYLGYLCTRATEAHKRLRAEAPRKDSHAWQRDLPAV